MKRGSLAADVAFSAMNRPQMADVHDLTDSGRRVSLFDPCPGRIRIIPRGGSALNRMLVNRILAYPNISITTKQIVRDASQD